MNNGVVFTMANFCSPIFTYGNQATKKRGVVPDEHAIVYSMGNVPQLLTGEKNMSKEPIAVMMADGIPPLSVASRIYFAIHHPVQYNVKAKDLGMVHPEYITRLLNHWGDVSGQQMW